ncbi:MAG: EpsI family protein [Rhodocyclaceae bacterium]|nr:EpsI family protein [Rhodocyclaceae bacterium]MDZ4216486.1 EpsI family protein [Rhodocyclaceae bacterium]
MSQTLPSLGRNLLLAGLLIAAAIAADLLRNAVSAAPEQAPDLARLVPERFSGWQLETGTILSPIQAAPDALTGTYALTLERVYRDADGARIMLSIAYGSRQRGDRLQAHRPEYCYRAQGFLIGAVQDGTLALAGAALPLRRLHAERPGRSEPVSYWLTVGDQAALPGVSRKLAQMRQLLSGQIPDGVLVRVSSIDSQPQSAWRQHDRFITDLLSSLPAAERERLAGRLASSLPAYRSQT